MLREEFIVMMVNKLYNTTIKQQDLDLIDFVIDFEDTLSKKEFQKSIKSNKLINSNYLKNIFNTEQEVPHSVSHEINDANLYDIKISVNLNEVYDTLYDQNIKKVIYRIESQQGEGIYRKNNHLVNHASHRPDPFSDGLLLYNQYYKNDAYTQKYSFAFNDVEQLKKWFNDIEEIETMIANSFQVSLYEVSENLILKSSSQCMFRKDLSTHIGYIDLNTVYEKEFKYKNDIMDVINNICEDFGEKDDFSFVSKKRQKIKS